MKRWVQNPCEDCEEHGASVEILTDAEQTIHGGACAFDGDECRCSEGCTGWMTADEDSFYCNWHESANQYIHVNGHSTPVLNIEGEKCPLFKRRAKRNKIITHKGKSFADHVATAKRRFPQMWEKGGVK